MFFWIILSVPHIFKTELKFPQNFQKLEQQRYASMTMNQYKVYCIRPQMHHIQHPTFHDGQRRFFWGVQQATVSLICIFPGLCSIFPKTDAQCQTASKYGNPIIISTTTPYIMHIILFLLYDLIHDGFIWGSATSLPRLFMSPTPELNSIADLILKNNTEETVWINEFM